MSGVLELKAWSTLHMYSYLFSNAISNTHWIELCRERLNLQTSWSQKSQPRYLYVKTVKYVKSHWETYLVKRRRRRQTHQKIRTQHCHSWLAHWTLQRFLDTYFLRTSQAQPASLPRLLCWRSSSLQEFVYVQRLGRKHTRRAKVATESDVSTGCLPVGSIKTVHILLTNRTQDAFRTTKRIYVWADVTLSTDWTFWQDVRYIYILSARPLVVNR